MSLLNGTGLMKLFSAFFMQGVNFLLPALTLPFLIRYLGPAEYGLFNLSQTWAIYFSVIIAYGFDLTATKQVTAGSKSVSELSGIYSKVFYTKLLLFAVSVFIFCSIVLWNSEYRSNAHIFLFMFLWTLNQLFFPGFLYLGLERQNVVTSFFIISRAGSFLIILLFIYLKFSLLSLVLAYSLPQALAGVVHHLITLKKYQIKLTRYSLRELIAYLKESFVLFLSTIAGTITVSVSIILIGFYLTQEAVGYFSVAAKLVSLMYGLVLFPFQIVCFPIIVRKIKESHISGVSYFLKLLAFCALVMAACSLAVYFYAPLIIQLFVGNRFADSIQCLRIICFVPFFALINMLFGYLFIALEQRRTYTFFQIMIMAICFGLNIILIPKYNITGSSFAWLIAETCGFGGGIIIFLKNHFSHVYSRKTLAVREDKAVTTYDSKPYSKRKVS